MTVTEPTRAGLAWEDEDHETLVQLAKERADLSAMAVAVQRGESATWQRLRLLLPVEHRKCPRDRIVPALHEAVQQPDYDWRKVILQTPSSPPVQEVLRTGLDGLEDDDLVRLTQIVAVWRESDASDLRTRLARCVDERGLRYAFVRRHVEHVYRGGMAGRTRDDLVPAVRQWFDSLLDRDDRPTLFGYDDGPIYNYGNQYPDG